MTGVGDFETRLIEFKQYSDGLLHSLLCTQDCLDLPGCGLWQSWFGFGLLILNNRI